MRSRWFLKGAGVVSLALIGNIGLGHASALAQATTQAVSADTLPARLQPLSRQIVAVYTLTQVRTSGRADAAMLARIDAKDAELRAALAALDAANTGTANAKAQAELAMEQARLRYQREAETLFAQLQLATSERDRYAQDLTSVLITASPSELEAQRRFGDGDFSVFDPMEAAILTRQAAEQANLRRGQAVALRQLATNYATMVAQGVSGRTRGELLVRWDRAAAADPGDFLTHIQRAAAASSIGNLVRSRDASNDALNVAATDVERSVALATLSASVALQGDYVEATKHLSASIALIDVSSISQPDPALLRQKSLSTYQMMLAMLAMGRDDVPASRRSFLEAVRIARARVQANLTAVEPRWHLSDILLLLGELEMLVGDLRAASVLFTESLELCRANLRADPSSVVAKRKEAHSYHQHGKVALLMSLDEVALIIFSENLVSHRAILEMEPASLGAKRDVAMTLLWFGKTKQKLSDYQSAKSVLTESITIFREIASVDPTAVQAQRELSRALLELGSIEISQRDIVSAKSAFDEGILIGRALIALNPDLASDRRELSESIEKMGDAARDAVYYDLARSAYTESLSMSRSILEINPASIQAKHDVATGLMKLGYLADTEGKDTHARDLYFESLTLRRELALENPNSVLAQGRLGESLWYLADLADSRVTWKQVIDQYTVVKELGPLTARQIDLLARAQRRINQPAQDN